MLSTGLVVEAEEVIDPISVIHPGPTKKSGLRVTCWDGSILELLVVQPPTRRAFPAYDFQNGYPDETIRWVRPPDVNDDDSNNDAGADQP